MKKRVLLLIGLLSLRLLPGWVSVLSYQKGREVRVAGEVVKAEQKWTKMVSWEASCEVRMGRFWFVFKDECRFSQRERLVVIGRTRVNLIDGLLGRIWLDEPKIISPVSEEKRELKRSKKEEFWTVWREKMTGVYRRLLPEPEAALVGGIVLGEKSNLGADFYQALVDSGTIHIVVASGYNVMIVGGMVLSILTYLWKRKWATGGAIGAMAVYALLAGGEAPVVRAVIMGSLVFGGQVLGRRSFCWWSLFLAAWVMVMIDPFLVEKISFQLTVAASGGLVLLEPRLRRWAEGLNWGWLKLILKTELVPTLSAQAMTGPIIWWHFQRLSWTAPISNVLVLPLVPLIMLLGGVMLLLGLVWLPLGQVVGWLVYSLAHLLVVIVEAF